MSSRASNNDLDVELLRAVLSYDPAIGSLTWLERPVEMFEDSTFRHRTGALAVRPASATCKWWNGRFAGNEAFTATHTNGFRHGRVFSGNYYAHIVAWALHYGEWPEDEVSFRDKNRANIRIANLFVAPHAQHMRSKVAYKSSPTGTHGVSMKKNGRWQAYITVNGKRDFLGYHASAAEAIAARQTAERESGMFHPNHGRGHGGLKATPAPHQIAGVAHV